MIIFKHSSDLLKYTESFKNERKSVGFVPTMGALHEGHLSLLYLAKQKSNITICSIFINPTQFNQASDLAKYPRTPEKDIEMLERAGCDLVYMPDAEDVYGKEQLILKDYDLSGLENILEGKSRPGHFKGVANVVSRLLQNVSPDIIFLGQKDFQQVLVINKMLLEENNKVEVVVAPIVRESNRLAMSSRNERLDPQKRKDAAGIYAALKFIKENKNKFSLAQLKEHGLKMLSNIPGAETDYLAFCNTNDLSPATDLNENIVVLTAVILGGVRLIDNIIINGKK